MFYRSLRREELEELEPQFVRFLAAQGVPAEDWTKIKVADAPRAEQLVSQFSQMVFDDVLRRAEYLEQRSKQQLLAYRCGPEVLELRGLLVVGESPIDFRTERSTPELLADLQRSRARLKVLSAERRYRAGRNEEVYALLEANARLATTAELFDTLDALTGDTPVAT